MIKEFNIFTADDLSAFDRLVKVSYQTGKIHEFSENNSSWKRSKQYASFIRDANIIANDAMKRIFDA